MMWFTWYNMTIYNTTQKTWIFEAACNDVTTLAFAVTSPWQTGSPAQSTNHLLYVQLHKHTSHKTQRQSQCPSKKCRKTMIFIKFYELLAWYWKTKHNKTKWCNNKNTKLTTKNTKCQISNKVTNRPIQKMKSKPNKHKF